MLMSMLQNPYNLQPQQISTFPLRPLAIPATTPPFIPPATPPSMPAMQAASAPATPAAPAQAAPVAAGPSLGAPMSYGSSAAQQEATRDELQKITAAQAQRSQPTAQAVAQGDSGEQGGGQGQGSNKSGDIIGLLAKIASMFGGV